MYSARSSGAKTGLCNPLLDNDSVKIFLHIGPRCERGDVINNREGVIHKVCAVLMKELNAEASSVQGSCESVLRMRQPWNFIVEEKLEVDL
jgi:hypothetical protein